MGCGEGWLARAIRSSTGAFVLGIDGSATLVERARQADPHGHYIQCTYGALAATRSSLTAECFDVAVFNFALFGGTEDTEALQYATSQLTSNGRLITQTLPGPERGTVDGVEDFASLPGDWAPVHYTSASLSVWRERLAEAGLVVITHRIIRVGDTESISWILEAQPE